jgi:hypothetical protein
MRKLLILTIIAFASSRNVFGSEADITVRINSLAIIATHTPANGHLADGNMEVKITKGFVIPAILTCTDNVYITTLKTTDPDRAMLSLLLKSGVPSLVRLRITDEAPYTAYPGRCSIRLVEIF